MKQDKHEVANKSNVIDLNGKWFDALTGAQLADKPDDAAVVQHVPVQAAPSAPRAGASLDGFVSKPSRAPFHVAAHKPQASQTLMRRAVKQPAADTAVAVQAQAPLQPSLAQPKATPVAVRTNLQPKRSSDVIDPNRAQRAQQADRSQAVQHFKPSAPQIQPAQAAAVLQSLQPQPQAASLTPAQRAQQQALAMRPRQDFQSLQAAQARPQQPLPGRSTADFVAARRTPQPLAANRPAASAIGPVPNHAPSRPQQLSQEAAQPAKDMFEAALARAASHNEPAPDESIVSKAKRASKRRRRALGIAGSAIVFLGLAGYIGWQNKANIQYQIASARAGFAASMPNYKPAGYSLGKLQYASGTVAALYQNSSSDNGAINIVQKKSNWDSQTLLENFVTGTGKDYQGYDANGRTVYVYGDNDATWVNGGIWYQIHSNNAMQANELVKIAANL